MRLLAGFLLLADLALAQSATPFSGTEVSRRFDSAGKLISESRFLFAMNRDGSIATVDLDPGAGGSRQIIDVVKRRAILVNTVSRSAAIAPYGMPQRKSQDPCEQRFHRLADAAVSVDKSAGTVHGTPVHRISVTLPQGVSMDILVAPSLACQMLRAETRRNGATSETRAFEDLRLGDPDPQLFEIPANYKLTEAAISH